MKQHGYIKHGQVYVSVPGRLSCKKVIHAVGPRWKDGNNHEEKHLRGAVYECMVAAEKCKMSSIALPALSGGLFGYPLDRCTNTIVTAVTYFLDDHKQSCLKKVSLVDPTERVVSAFHQSFGIVSRLQRAKPSDHGHSASLTGEELGLHSGMSEYGVIFFSELRLN